MRANEIKEFLKNLYEKEKTERTSVLLLGGPGIGKTTAVLETAQEIAETKNKIFVEYDDAKAEKILQSPEKYFVFHNLPLVGCEPSDLTGIPRLADDAVRYYPLLWAKVMNKCAGFLFLDDFLDVQRADIFSASYRIFLERRIGYTYLNNDVQIVGASNTPDYSSLTQMMPAPLANRMCIVEITRPTVDEWAEWMNKKYQDKWNKKIYAFLKSFEEEGEDYLYKPPKENETIMPYPTPRSWSNVGKLNEDKIEVLKGFVGEEMAQKFKAFTQLNLDITDLIANPYKFNELNTDAQYMATLMLASALSKEITSISTCMNLLNTIVQKSREMLVLLVISLPKEKRRKILNKMLKENPNITDALEGVVCDRESIASDLLE